MRVIKVEPALRFDRRVEGDTVTVSEVTDWANGYAFVLI